MDEAADLALLDQHLLKTNLLSQRMTGILGQLDTRLSRLDKAITPLGLQPLTRKAANIDALLEALLPPLQSRSQPSTTSLTRAQPASISRTHSSTSSTSSHPPPSSQSHSHQKGYSLGPTMINPTTSHLTPIQSAAPSVSTTPADEVAILTRGPDIMALGEYFVALEGVLLDLERMWRGVIDGRGGAREAGVKDLSKLVEIGYQGLCDLFLKISEEGMGRTIDPQHMIDSGPPTPPNYFPSLQTLVPLTTRMINLLNPSTPTPKTESVIRPIFDDTINTYGRLRGGWQSRGFGGMIDRVEEVDEGGIWEGGRGKEKVRALVGLWEGLIAVIEAEILLITTLFPHHPPSALLQSTLSQPFTLLTSTLQPTLSIIKKSLSTHTFTALSLYQSLSSTSQTLESILSTLPSQSPLPNSNPLLPTLSTLRALILRSFPELLVDIKMTKYTNQPTSGISDVTYSTLGYLEGLPGYHAVVEGLLGRSSQSERSWLMGGKQVPGVVTGGREREGGVVCLFVADLLGTLLIHLRERAEGMRKPIGPAFLLNNLSHIRNTTSGFNSDIIGPGAEDLLNKGFREAKSQYITDLTLPLLTPLQAPTSTPRFTPKSVNPLSNSDRSQLKEAANVFYDRLGETERISADYPLSRGDVEMRERVGGEVGGLVGRGWEGFLGRCAGKGVEKYLKNTPDELARRVQAMFR